MPRKKPPPFAPEILALRACVIEYERLEELFRNAVELERIDEDRRRFSRDGRPATPVSTPGAAERHGEELAERLPELVDTVRTAIAAAAGRPTDRDQPISAVARDVELLTVAEVTALAVEGWRDPWASGRHGETSRHDPPRPDGAAPRRRVGARTLRGPAGRPGRVLPSA